MSCWSGFEDHSEDRMCRPSQLNIPLALTLIGCSPPGSLQHYLRQAMSKGGGADGFMQCFQIVCYSDHNAQFVLTEDGVPSELEVMIQSLFDQLDSQENRNFCFSEETQTLFKAWLVENVNNARSRNHSPYRESHLGKQAKVLAMCVIILHRINEILESNESNGLDLKHAKPCYESVLGGVVSDGEIILDLLQKNAF